MIPQEIFQEALALPPDERAKLAHLLIGSLDGDEDTNAEAALDAEFARRVDAIDRGIATGRPAEHVFEDIRKKYS